MLTFETHVQSDIPQWLNEMVSAVDITVQETAELVAGYAQGFVRQETGSLHDTIHAERSEFVSSLRGISQWEVLAGDIEGGYKGGGKVATKIGKTAGAPVDYAAAQEYGPGEHSPYMTPAAEQGWVVYQQLLTAALGAIG